WVQAMWFKLLGDHFFTEKIFSGLCFLLTAFLYFKALRKYTGPATASFGILLLVCISRVSWGFVNNLLEVLIVPLLFMGWLVLLAVQRKGLRWEVIICLAFLANLIFLIKGPVAFAVPFLPLAFFFQKEAKRSLLVYESVLATAMAVVIFAVLF